jgi:hypothetical protein
MRVYLIVFGSCFNFFGVALCVSTVFGQRTVYPPDVSLQEIQHRINECRHDHPRLLASRSDLARLPEHVNRDPLQRKLADLVVQQAKQLQDVAPVERKLTGRRLLGESRSCVERVLTLATAYHLTHDVKHAERCRKEMLAAARFRDWNPSHFLDVAEMTFALAIGYDWLYDHLDEASRREIRTAIVDKGVRVPFETPYNGWVRRTNNWGQVCHGGLTAGALAVLEDEPTLAARTVHNALENVVFAMSAYAPRGSYPEGPSYWAYGTSYNVLLIAMLESVFNTDFGLSRAPGFDETGAYPALVCGPSGLFFNYADGHSGRHPDPIRFWLAARYQRPDWLMGERELWQKQVSEPNSKARSSQLLPLALLWMGESTAKANVHLPLNWYSAGIVPIAIHRSSWSDPRATFIGLKGGSPSANHGHMDTGSFVLDSDGVRWATDLGAEDYYRIESRNMDLWGREQNSDRWTVFRLSNLGHNTLVIDGKLQVPSGNAPIVQFSDDALRPFSILDMSSVYSGQAGSVKRGVALLPSREVLIQDQLTGLRVGSRVRWTMITTGEPEVVSQSVVRLRQSGKQLTLSVVSPNTDGWNDIDTSQPRNEWDSPNPGTRMVAFKATAPESGEMTLAVVATPGTCSNSVVGRVKVSSLQSWSHGP